MDGVGGFVTRQESGRCSVVTVCLLGLVDAVELRGDGGVGEGVVVVLAGGDGCLRGPMFDDRRLGDCSWVSERKVSCSCCQMRTICMLQREGGW